MTFNRVFVPALAICLYAAGLNSTKASGSPQTPGSHAFGQDNRAWDAPPPEFREVQRRGFRDGIDGARRDFGNHRRPDVNNRDEYRNPAVPRHDLEAYRDGFRRGYEKAMSHLMGEPDRQSPQVVRPMPEPERGWDAPPPEFREMQRRGFLDGVEGARKDFSNHRRPDVNNREEYRYANFPPRDLEAYKEGFRRGYQQGASHLWGDRR